MTIYLRSLFMLVPYGQMDTKALPADFMKHIPFRSKNILSPIEIL